MSDTLILTTTDQLPAVPPLPGATQIANQFASAATDARYWLEQAAERLQQADAFDGDVAAALTLVNDHLVLLEQNAAIVPQLLTGLHAALQTLTDQRNQSIEAFTKLKQRVTREVEVAYSEGMMHIFECGDCYMAAERETDVEHLAQLISEEGEDAIAEYQKEAADRIREARELVGQGEPDGEPQFLVNEIDKEFVGEHTDFDTGETLRDFYGASDDEDEDESEDFEGGAEADDDEA